MKTPSHARSMQGKTAVERAAAQVRRSFARRRSPGDLDDVEQDAALGALEAIAAGNVDLSARTSMSYLRTAGRRTAGAGVSQALAVVTIPRKKAALARQWQHRVSIVGCGVGEGEEGEETDAIALMSYDTPEAAGDEARGARARRLGIARLVPVIAQHAKALPAGERVVAEVVLGLRPGTTPARTFREVSWRTGVTVSRARAVFDKLTARVFADAQIGTMNDYGGTP